LGFHQSISCEPSRSRAARSRLFLHDVLLEALSKESAYGGADLKTRLEQALVVAFLKEISAPMDLKASAPAVCAALRRELLMPLRALNEGQIRRTFQGQPLPAAHVAAAVRALTEAVASEVGGFPAWRYTNPAGLEQLRGLSLAQASYWRHALSVDHAAGLRTHEGDESELDFFWATKIGGPSHGFDYEAQCLLPLLCNARHKVILVSDPNWQDYPCGRCHFRLLWAELPSPPGETVPEPLSPALPSRRSRSVPPLPHARSDFVLSQHITCAPRLWLEGLHGDFEAVQGGLGRNWLPAVLRHAIVKSCQLQVPLLVDLKLIDAVRAVSADVHGIVCECCERLILRPSNGVVEASDYLSRKHDWVQLNEEVTEPLRRAKFTPGLMI